MSQSLSNNTRIKNYEPLISINEMRKENPQSDISAQFILKHRQEIFDILDNKDNRIIVITGPCSIHDEKIAYDYANRLLPLREKYSDKLSIIMRVYFEKPRTNIGWKGLISDPDLNGTNNIAKGLKLARKILLNLSSKGIPCATELLDPIIAAYIGELISWAAIGARTTESQTHRQMASGLSAPVGFKNGTDGNLKVALNAMQSSCSPHSFLSVNDDGVCSIVETKGNPYGHIVLRGGAGKPNYHMDNILMVEKILQDHDFPLKIMVDCSHDNSNKDHSKQGIVFKDIIAQKKLGNKSIMGVMLESNIEEGNQKITEDLSQLKYGVSLTDKCINWETTEELLEFFYQNI